jgi:hypothetical protein
MGNMYELVNKTDFILSRFFFQIKINPFWTIPYNFPNEKIKNRLPTNTKKWLVKVFWSQK